MDREAALQLLQDNHEFPGIFEFRLVVRPEHKAQTVSAIAAAAPGDVARVDERVSRKGTYVALHIAVQVQAAEDVLEIYKVIGGLEHVITQL